MINITVNGNTDKDFEQALNVFKKKCSNDGFVKEIKERQYYKKPSEIRHEKKRNYKRKLVKERVKRKNKN